MISCRFFDFCILTQNPFVIFPAKTDIVHNDSTKMRYDKLLDNESLASQPTLCNKMY